MARKMADCRRFDNEFGCTLTIIGEEDEVVRTAAEHAVSVHGHEDSAALRDQICDAFEKLGDLRLAVQKLEAGVGPGDGGGQAAVVLEGKDEVGVARTLGAAMALGEHQPRDLLGVVDVHLAAEGLDVE